MRIRHRITAVTAASLLSVGAFTGTAMAAPADRAVTQTGGAAGLVAAVVQANIQDVDVNVINGDVNVEVQNVLNNNRILQNILNNNDIDVTLTDVVDVTIVDNVLVINVLSDSSIADLA